MIGFSVPAAAGTYRKVVVNANPDLTCMASGGDRTGIGKKSYAYETRHAKRMVSYRRGMAGFQNATGMSLRDYWSSFFVK